MTKICPNCQAPIYGDITYCVCGTRLKTKTPKNPFEKLFRELTKDKDKCRKS